MLSNQWLGHDCRQLHTNAFSYASTCTSISDPNPGPGCQFEKQTLNVQTPEFPSETPDNLQKTSDVMIQPSSGKVTARLCEHHVVERLNVEDHPPWPVRKESGSSRYVLPLTERLRITICTVSEQDACRLGIGHRGR